MGLLDGQIAVVTGSARGIGFAIAERFVSEGARVVIADLDEAAIDQAVQTLGRDHALGVRCDVAKMSDVENLVSVSIRAMGSLDIMINNAGITRDATLHKMSESDFDQVIAVHLKGAWNGTKMAGMSMREQGSGNIINISSISGKVGFFGQTNYSAAKAGIVGLTKAAAKELAAKGVRVNAIQPGLIRSPMTEAMRHDIWERKIAEIPMGRPGEPGEIASVALFLASDLSAYMTGTVLEVAGGRHM